MIPVERSVELDGEVIDKAKAETDKMAKKMTQWFAKIEQALAANSEPPSKPDLDFKRYKAPEVKDALGSLFAGKCAYCESFYSSTQPMDVEHFRPKGAVKAEGDEAGDHPGYYWLAASFENLLPSCIDCNRQRTQEEVVRGENQIKQLGKKDRFPLLKGGVRAARPADDPDVERQQLAAEKPALIDPTVDDPRQFFEYDLEIGIVVPKTKSGIKHERAKASIEIYGLNRSALVQDRMHVIRMIDHRLRLISGLAKLKKGLGDRPDVQEILVDLITQEIDLLRQLERPNRAYSALVRQLLSDLDEAAAQA